MLIPIDIKSPLIKFWPHSKMGSCGVWNYVTRYWRQKEYKSGLPHFSRSQFSTFLSLRGGGIKPEDSNRGNLFQQLQDKFSSSFANFKTLELWPQSFVQVASKKCGEELKWGCAIIKRDNGGAGRRRWWQPDMGDLAYKLQQISPLAGQWRRTFAASDQAFYVAQSFPQSAPEILLLKSVQEELKSHPHLTEQWVSGEMERGVLDLFYCLMEEQD